MATTNRKPVPVPINKRKTTNPNSLTTVTTKPKGTIQGVGYEPIPGALSWGGCGHQMDPNRPGVNFPPYQTVILPKDTVWTTANLTVAFGPGYFHGPTGPDGWQPHSSDFSMIAEENFALGQADWLNGPNDPAYTLYTGKMTEWENLYAWQTLDRRLAKSHFVFPADNVTGIDPLTAVADIAASAARIEQKLDALLAKTGIRLGA